MKTFLRSIGADFLLESPFFFLEEKGFLEREPVAHLFRYKVKISERQYRGTTVSDVVARYYGNSYTQLVSQFVEDEKINLDELKALIESIEKPA